MRKKKTNKDKCAILGSFYIYSKKWVEFVFQNSKWVSKILPLNFYDRDISISFSEPASGLVSAKLILVQLL